jgi:hypothetical protein
MAVTFGEDEKAAVASGTVHASQQDAETEAEAAGAGYVVIGIEDVDDSTR